MADAVFAVTATLCQSPSATLLDVPALLGSPSFRRSALVHVTDPVTREFWTDYESLSEGQRRELARPVLHRLRGLYRSRAVRNLLCQTSGPDFGSLLDGGRVILVSLAGPEVQAEADLLGELLIARLHLALMARLGQDPRRRHQAFLLVDEAQRFQGASLPVLLAEGRKLGCGLLLSTQFVEALGERLAESSLSNVGATVVFRCGPRDARRLAPILRPFTAEDVEDLDRFEAIAKIQAGGRTLPAFDFITLPIDHAPDLAALERIRAHSREEFARPRPEVETELLEGTTDGSGVWNGIYIYEA